MDWGSNDGGEEDDGNTQMDGVEVEMPPGGINNSEKRNTVEVEDASDYAETAGLDIPGLVSPMLVENLTDRFGGKKEESSDGHSTRGENDSGDETSGGSSGGGAAENDTERSEGLSEWDEDQTAGDHPAELTQDLQMEAKMVGITLQMAAMAKLLAQYQAGTNAEDAEMEATYTTASNSQMPPDDQGSNENTVDPARATAETEDAGEKDDVPSQPG